MAFDYLGARKEGYSDEEIASHLASSSGFDISGAVESGYSYSEIAQHLTGTPVETEVVDDPSARDSTIGEEFGRGANRLAGRASALCLEVAKMRLLMLSNEIEKMLNAEGLVLVSLK